MQTTDLQWSTTKLRINDLVPFEGNPRQMTDAQAVQLKASLEKFNLVEIPAVNTNGKILAGHQRLKIMQILGRGQELVDCRIPNRMLTPEEEREYLLRSNKNTGEWDFDALANFDEELLKTIGFSSKELDRIFDLKGGDEDDVPDVPATARAERGKIYTLGKHRVMCGDSTNAGDVDLLMDGKKADMVFTSPPYNVGIKYSTHDDNMPIEKYFDFIRAVAQNMFDSLNDGRIIAWNVGVSPKSMPHKHITMLEGIGYTLFRNIVWKKTGCQIPLWQNSKKNPQARHYLPNYNHEMIYLLSKGDVQLGEITEMDDEIQMDVWDICQFSAGGHDHPAGFPVKLADKAIKALSAKDEIIHDPFCGSGSTLIACEQTGRICYGMEINPKYVDVIIERWCTFTGNDREAVYARAQQPEKQP